MKKQKSNEMQYLKLNFKINRAVFRNKFEKLVVSEGLTGILFIDQNNDLMCTYFPVSKIQKAVMRGFGLHHSVKVTVYNKK